MGFFGSVKNAAVKAKINGEISLIDREISNRKRSFGVELFDLIESNSSDSRKMPALFRATESQLEGPLNRCRKDIMDLDRESRTHSRELDQIEAKRERQGRAITPGEQAQRAGEWISDAGTSSKLEVKVALLKRKIKQRKEEFGLEIWDIVSGDATQVDFVATDAAAAPAARGKSIKGALGGMGKSVRSKIDEGVKTVKAGVSDNLSKLNKVEQEIQKCIDQAKNDVNRVLNKRQSKEREIANLERSAS
eukprot:CAMPEP_0202449852 /NCGR_PEP_ID=MMETSP1360-20130828/8541_1 /ASSEMBLY_ACC=CAM_ASM_000848 /TAXON_ID=515479 /ORGANISM="Licmophora paradoxa, Strain CCMP2313" /LENGTH=248 /DNA_ID=CAMNT_0049067913 /DNA_START=27 /DNA_END=773 /DNA_ORIENTATION=-